MKSPGGKNELFARKLAPRVTKLERSKIKKIFAITNKEMFEDNENPRLTDDDQLNLGNLQHFDNHDFTQIRRQQDDASFVLFVLGFIVNVCWVVNWALHRFVS